MMQKTIDEICNLLADQLRQGNAIAFLGSAVSKTYKDDRMDKTYPGIKTAREIVEDLSTRKLYIKSSMKFEQAFFSVKHKEGRTEVERLLDEYINIPNIEPLPAHFYLSDLNFSAYLTTNFDVLMERAFDNREIEYAVIIEDSDVSRWQMKNKVPIVKLHGSITRPKTIIAAEDEYKAFGSRGQILASVLKVLLANKTILFCGFSLLDVDFKMAYQELKDILGDYMPRSYAIVKNVEEYDRSYWESQNVTLIDFDLTQFLKKLRSTFIENKHYDNSGWTNNTFLDKLSQSKTSPTETQAINAFLYHLREEIKNPKLTVNDILVQAESAIKDIKTNKSMFISMKKMWEELENVLSNIAEEDIDNIEQMIDDIVKQRNLDAESLSRKHRGLIKKDMNILLYSQSVRVIDLLKSVSNRVQQTCNIYICECRPKSANPFQDAIDISNYLQDTMYKKSIIPDATVGNLIGNKLIDIVIMGAHTLYYKDDKFISFVNTCGTNTILNSARLNNVPVYVIAESSKRQDLDNHEMEDIIYDEEKDTFNNRLKNEGIRINTKVLNIRYDLCEITDNITLLTDK